MQNAVHDSELYDAQFFSARESFVSRSIAVVAPLIVEMFQPRSLIDVGCGDGQWVSAYRRLGVERVVGVDGDYVDSSRLKCAPEEFRSRDLRMLKPGSFTERFDLVTCLEVAEHLPDANAEGFIDVLTYLSDVVVFSAAVPGQGGVGHINCQWPPYWIEKFEKRGFVYRDAIRPRIWQEQSVAWWYRQNIVVFGRPEAIAQYPEVDQSPSDPFETLTMLHPSIAWKRNPKVREALRLLAGAVRRSMRARLNRLV